MSARRHVSRDTFSFARSPLAGRQRAALPRQALDERGRGYGGFHASCAEENLLKLPSDRWADHRDICTHEFAHTCLTWGLGPAFEVPPGRLSRAAGTPACC